ncbi:MAG TPA: HEAT repeat domain-containing protein [Polyangiaceae bacterium]
MLHTNPGPAPKPVSPPIPHVDLAKWPPDDDVPGGPAMPGIPAGGGYGGYGGGDGDFKTGRFKPAVIIVGIVAVIGFVAFLGFGMKKDAERLTIEQGEAIKKDIFLLPKTEQIAKWREWAAKESSDEVRSEALKQLAWARDPQGVPLAAAALVSPSDAVQGMAALALAEYGRPMGEGAKDALLASLKTAGPGAKPQIAWALVVLGDTRAFDEVMNLYRLGHLAKVQRLGGGSAFDPSRIVALVSLDKLAAMADDPSASVRQLVATVLSGTGDPKWTDVLIKLVKDKDAEVARQAAPGLGRIGDAKAREPLVAALKGVDKESRTKYFEALRDGIGTEGLVVALEAAPTEDDPTETRPQPGKAAWYFRKQLLNMIYVVEPTETMKKGQGLNDPAGADALFKYIETNPHVHLQTHAALALAAIGDVRAIPTLAKRLRMDPLKIYSDQYDWEMALKRTDDERVEASRMIADLAVIHADKRAQIAEQAEDAVIFWLHERTQPHANGLRALAAMGSTKDIEAMRKWAAPDVPLPKEGQHEGGFPPEWEIAQSALRYVGWLKDEQSWREFEKALTARPKDLDVTMDGLYKGGLAMLGMALRAIGVGAAEGMSQWRNNKGFKPLLEYIEEPKNNEQSRKAACAALAWVAETDDFIEIAKKIDQYKGNERPDEFRRECLLEALIQRPVPGTANALFSLMTPQSAIETRHQVARALAKGGFDAGIEAKLFEMLKVEELMNDAALALMLGGSPDTASRALAAYANKPAAARKPALDELGELWYKSFGYWSTEDLEAGLLFKYVDNAEAMSRISIAQTPQEWARVMLEKQFDNLLFDNGPHSFTRVVLRKRLLDMAKGNDEAKRAGAIRTLKFMKERGVLLALRNTSGPGQEAARLAYFELLNAKVVQGVTMPDDGKK